jgi:glutaryl-CoA dehydrogenase
MRAGIFAHGTPGAKRRPDYHFSMQTLADTRFNWRDPLLLEQQLTDDERMVRDTARAYCQEKLAPRVLEAFRSERAEAAAIYRELGELDMLAITTPQEYGGRGSAM